MATKRRSYIFARSRVIELPLTDRDFGTAPSSMPVDTRRQGRLKMNYSPLGGARCTASRSASYQTGDKRGAVEKAPIRVAEFPGSKFRKRFALALAEPRRPRARGSCFPAVAVDFPASVIKNPCSNALGI